MKTYIFLTTDITSLGGIQMYISSKIKMLEKDGWNIKVLYSSYTNDKCIVSDLERFKNCMVQGINICPFLWPKREYNNILNKAIEIIGNVNDMVINESHNDSYALWGEILAKKLKAKHIIVLLNELFRGKEKYYEEKIQFYYFKYSRGEIGGTKAAFSKLFEGHKPVPNPEKYVYLIDENPIQDIVCKSVDSMERRDWNICYIGRPEKNYVPTIINEVVLFAVNHPDRSIHFAMLGDKDIYKRLFSQISMIPTNLTVTMLGTLIPIPRKLFQKIDVFIAGGGSARAAAYEKAVVIVPDSDNYLANGLLGYEVTNACHCEEGDVQRPINEALERVLVEKVQEKMAFNYEQDGVEKCYLQNFEFIKRSSQDKQYYPETEILKSSKKVPLKRKIVYYLAQYCPLLTKKILHIMK